MSRVSTSSIWREIALWLAALAVFVQATTLSAHLAHAAAGQPHAVLCSGDMLPDDGMAPARMACPICQVPQTGGLLPPVCASALPIVFDGRPIEFAVVSAPAPQKLRLHQSQPRAPPGLPEKI
ncbi:MAG: hypothetical protein O9320_12545 [Magnetospirillum sp.]|nr:hypothetical protein [Magnetospirillum sp.]